MIVNVLVVILVFQKALGNTVEQVTALPLNRFGFVRSHDAATGYLVDDGYESTIINRWTRTQSENITTQLNCGVRAIDWRPILVNGTVFMHHGEVTVPVRQADMIKEVVAWAASSEKLGGEDYEQLVLINVWDCWNSGCDEKAYAEFKDAGIPTLASSDLPSLTVGRALELAKLTTGGYVLAIEGDVGVPGWVTYNQYFECHGFVDLAEEQKWRDQVTTCINRTLDQNEVGIDFQRVVDCILSFKGILMKAEHYNCWKDSNTHALAYNQVLDLMMKFTSMDPPSGGELWEATGAWAEDVADLTLGFFLESNMLEDEVKSGLNLDLAAELKNETKIVHHPPMIGINNVCDGGEELRQALLGRVLKLAEKL